MKLFPPQLIWTTTKVYEDIESVLAPGLLKPIGSKKQMKIVYKKLFIIQHTYFSNINFKLFPPQLIWTTTNVYEDIESVLGPGML